MPNIILLGFMGTGKTCVGKRLAERLGMGFLDMDDLIEEEEGMPIRKIFKRFGEPYFREKETSICERVSGFNNYVIATGGGVVLKTVNIENLRRNGILISLTATPEVIYERTKKARTRPLLEEDPKRKIQELLKVRDPYYRMADWMLDTSMLSIPEVVDKIVAYLYQSTSTWNLNSCSGLDGL